MNEIPDGWEWKTLSQVLIKQSNGRQLQQGWSPRCETFAAGDDHWGVLKTTAIQPGRFDGSQNKQLPSTFSPKPSIEVKVGDLLITSAGPRSRCGVPTLVRQSRSRLMMSGKMYRFRPNESLDSRFLEAWLLGAEAQARIDKMKTGISDSGLNLTHDRFLALPVPVPPVDEQHRIIEILESHISRIDVGVAQLSRAMIRADAWMAGVENALVWNQSAVTRPIGSLLREPMRNGRSDRAVGEFQNGTRTLTITAVTRNAFVDEHTKFTSTSPKVAEKLWIEPGDIFVQRANTPELVGTAARYEGPVRWAIFPDLLIRLRANEDVVDSRYLVAAIRTERTHRALRKKAKGLASSMPKIDQSDVATTVIPVPSLPDQLRVVAVLSDASALHSRTRQLIAQAYARANRLRSSVFASALAGQLTANNTREPISA